MKENKNVSLINNDFSGISDVANNLINKLSDCVGWCANRETPKKIAISTYIADIQKSNRDPLVKAALISNAKKILKEYCNQYDIINIAINSLKEDSTPESIDEDWISIFMDRARLVSSEEFKLIWGRLLAVECEDNGSIPEGLLHILSQMDRQDAQMFTAVCAVSVRINDEYSPVIDIRQFSHYKKYGLDFDKLVNLRALGLIEMDFTRINAYQIESNEVPIKVHYYNWEYELSKSKEEVNIGNVVFTKSGQALCKAIVTAESEGFWKEYCFPYLLANNH